MSTELQDPEVVRQRAVAIGNALETAAWRELIPLLSHPAPMVRRAAASAMGKLVGRSASIADGYFLPLQSAALEETAEQVQQYMLKALRVCITVSPNCSRAVNDKIIAAFTDLARNPTKKPYVRDAANDLVAAMQEAQRFAEAKRRHWCTRCRKPITAEESAAGIRKYGKPYCRHCLDERQFEDLRFEAEVESAKRLRTADRVAVQSRGERIIGNWLAAHGIDYNYDERYRIVEDVALRPDFYLPAYDLYIEYWGMDTRDYLARKAEKKFLYQRAGKRLVSFDYTELDHLEAALTAKLAPLLAPKAAR